MKLPKQRKNRPLVSPMVRVGGEMKIHAHEPPATLHGLEHQTAYAAVALENSSAAHAALCDAEFVREALRRKG